MKAQLDEEMSSTLSDTTFHDLREQRVPWLQARPASGRRVAWKQVHIFRLTGDTIVEYRAVRDDLRVLEAIDAA
jgi:hypothetical protein